MELLLVDSDSTEYLRNPDLMRRIHAFNGADGSRQSLPFGATAITSSQPEGWQTAGDERHLRMSERNESSSAVPPPQPEHSYDRRTGLHILRTPGMMAVIACNSEAFEKAVNLLLSSLGAPGDQGAVILSDSVPFKFAPDLIHSLAAAGISLIRADHEQDIQQVAAQFMDEFIADHLAALKNIDQFIRDNTHD